MCGGRLGLFSWRRLKKGAVCRNCSEKLSPFFTGMRESTADEIREQIACRERNRAVYKDFKAGREFGENDRIVLDEKEERFVVYPARYTAGREPDVIDVSSVRDAVFETDETKVEVKYKDRDGLEVSYDPPKYQYRFDYFAKIHTKSPYYPVIRIKLNKKEVGGMDRDERLKFMAMGEEIKAALLKDRAD